MLKRQRQIADQRYDLPHYNRMLDSIAYEFQIYNKHFFSAENKVLKNFLIENAGGLDVKINQSGDSMAFHMSESGKENIIFRESAADVVDLSLADDAINYVELQIFSTTSGSEAVAIWDSIANSQQGEEFSQVSDTCDKLDVRLVSTTISFTGDPDKIPMAIVTTSGGAIADINDQRSFYWRLETDYDFGVVRTDDSITTLKGAWDAITTIMKEVKGTTNWYDEQNLSTMDLLERSNYMLIDGGKIDWEMAGIEALRWSANLTILVPNQAFDYTIDAQTVASVTDGDIVYVTLPDVGVVPTGSLVVNTVATGSFLIDPTNTRNFILAYRSGGKIYFGNGWQNIELESGEQNELGDGITTALLIATGLTDENDSTPPYTSTFIVTPGTNFTNAISLIDIAVQQIFDLISGVVYNEFIDVGVGGLPVSSQITLPTAQSYEVATNNLEVYYDGRFMEIGEDYIEIDDGGGVGTKIELLYAIPEGYRVKFRIQIGGSFVAPPPVTAVQVSNSGVLKEANLFNMNFTGVGVTVVQTSAGNVDVNVPGLIAGPSSLPPTLSRQNITGGNIPAGRLVYLLADDTIAQTDADIGAKGAAIGITPAPITDTSFGDIYTLGWVIPGVLDTLNILPGEMVYMSETEGLMLGENDPNLPTDLTDVVFKIGVATNLVGGEAKDLIMQAEREFN
jgi:hypothetical protein